VPEDDEGGLSDPDSNEDVYVSVRPTFLADRLEEIIPIVQSAERRGQRESQAKRGLYRGASSQGLLRYLKGDDRWTFVHLDSVDVALKYLEEDGRAWMTPNGQWQLTV
jgi:solute carrier family 25 citrate transporter 1